MAINTYAVGTISIAGTGATTATGVGTSWTAVNGRSGDIVQVGNQITLIGDAPDATHLTIPPWPGGAVVAQPYKIYQTSPLRFAGGQAMADISAAVTIFNTYPLVVDPALAVPDPSLGNESQYAFQITTAKWWKKSGGVWVFQGTIPGLLASNNLSDVPDKAAARGNLAVPGLATANAFAAGQRFTAPSYASAFITTNTSSDATNINKFFRMTPVGDLEIVNSGFTAGILSLSDAGVLSIGAVASRGNVSAAGRFVSQINPANGWALDCGTTPVSVPNGSVCIFQPGSGEAVLTNWATGGTGKFIMGSGSVALLGQTSTDYAAAPVSGKIAIAYASANNAYYIYNLSGVTVLIGVALILTRYSP